MKGYADFKKIVQIQFMLQKDIINFVGKLPRWLRNIKTATVRNTFTGRQIRGNIQWGETCEARYSQNFKDRSLFVSADPKEEDNIAENLVLKRFLSILYTILDALLQKYLEEDHDWVKQWGSLEARKSNAYTLKQIYERNIHLSQIRPSQKITLTPRMIQRAKKSRKQLYRKGTQHYLDYQKCLRCEKNKIMELLTNTSIQPWKDYKIFEIYAVFKIINAVRQATSGKLKQKAVERGAEWIAEFNGDYDIKIYYDTMLNDFQIQEKQKDKGDRREKIESIYNQILSHYFNETRKEYTRRPDIIIKINNEKPRFLFFEVKYSSRKSTIYQGIQELFEYLGFLRQENNKSYTLSDKDIPRKGAVIIESFPSTQTNENKSVQKAPIPIFTYKDLANENVLNKFIENNLPT